MNSTRVLHGLSVHRRLDKRVEKKLRCVLRRVLLPVGPSHEHEQEAAGVGVVAQPVPPPIRLPMAMPPAQCLPTPVQAYSVFPYP